MPICPKCGAVIDSLSYEETGQMVLSREGEWLKEQGEIEFFCPMCGDRVPNYFIEQCPCEEAREADTDNYPCDDCPLRARPFFGGRPCINSPSFGGLDWTG